MRLILPKTLCEIDPDYGAEPSFPGLGQIQRNFNFATKSKFPIYGTLAETVAAAIKRVH
jgi:hypothetical protein